MTLNPVCENVETAQGVPLTVTGVAQVKIMKNADLLQTASEQFLGKKEHEIKSTVLQTLEGHLRAILGKHSFFCLPSLQELKLNLCNWGPFFGSIETHLHSCLESKRNDIWIWIISYYLQSMCRLENTESVLWANLDFFKNSFSIFLLSESLELKDCKQNF